MQLSAISLALTRAGMLSFDPVSLFQSGAQGVFFDISDYSTMFEDSAGTIPITTPLEKPVGLMLDKSKGLVLGPELVTNGDFSNGTTGWTLGAGWTISGGKANYDATSSAGGIRQTITANNWQEISFTISGITSGQGRLIIYTGNTATIIWSSTNVQNGTYTFKSRFPLVTNIDFYAYNNDGGSPRVAFSIDNISVRELPGNHATQSTTTSRPTLSARYNLLTKTEQFDDAAWTKGQGGAVTVTPNTHISPNGTITSDTITAASGPSAIWTTFTGGSLVSGSYIYSCSVIKGKSFNLTIDDATANGIGVFFNGTTGVGTIVSLGSGWTVTNFSCATHPDNSNYWLASMTIVRPSTTPSANIGIRVNTKNSATYGGDSNSGDTLVVWGADLRVANDGIGLPAYQRVNTSTDYDTVGFPPYLKFDGTDDGMATGNIDFTGTDKMFVAAGVRKLSDAAPAVLVESSSGISSNNGVVLIYAPGDVATAGYRYLSASKGTATSIATTTATTYSAPVTNVLTSINDISGDREALRINGTQVAADTTTDQGTGNYGNYPLYIGRRGGTTLPFNGRLYSLVVCGKLASAAEIASTEAYINQKTRAY